MIADVNSLKLIIIEEFDQWLRRASYGHVDKYDSILHKISLVQAWNDIDNVYPIYEFLTSN